MQSVSPPVAEGDPGVLLQATLEPEPYSTEAFDVVDPMREAADGAAPGTLIGGASAVEFDVREAAAWDSTVIPPIVLVVVFLILVVLLRAVIAPLVLIGTVILSFLAALGVGYFVFDVFFGFPGSDPSLPLFAFVFLVALGVDYNIFLMARAREETLKHGTREGILRALAVTGGVITSAGIVLAGTFSVLAVLPLVFLTEIGFVVAFGVLLDTFLVRSVLVPAIVFKLGPRVWWPSKLMHKPRERPMARPASGAPPRADSTSRRARRSDAGSSRSGRSQAVWRQGSPPAPTPSFRPGQAEQLELAVIGVAGASSRTQLTGTRAARRAARSSAPSTPGAHARRRRAQPERPVAADLVQRERPLQPPLAAAGARPPRQRQRAEVVGRPGVDALLGAGRDQPDVARRVDRRAGGGPARPAPRAPTRCRWRRARSAWCRCAPSRSAGSVAGVSSVPITLRERPRPGTAKLLHRHAQAGRAEGARDQAVGTRLGGARGRPRAPGGDAHRDVVGGGRRQRQPRMARRAAVPAPAAR